MAPRRRTRMATDGSGDPADAADQPPGQRRRPDDGQFRLQVDRQTKSSYTTYAAAEAAGLAIKQDYPILHVAVYDAVDGVHKLIELPAPQ